MNLREKKSGNDKDSINFLKVGQTMSRIVDNSTIINNQNILSLPVI